MIVPCVLFKARFQFLVTRLSGEVWLLHGVGGGRGCAQAGGHRVCSPERSVFREMVDESKSEMFSWHLIWTLKLCGVRSESNIGLTILLWRAAHISDLLVILVVNVRKTPLLGVALHLVPSSYHQTVHHIHGVVTYSFQHEPKQLHTSATLNTSEKHLYDLRYKCKALKFKVPF